MRNGNGAEQREGKGHVEKPFLWLLPLRARLTQALLWVHSVFTILPCPCHLLFFLPGLLAVEAWSPHHWIVREFPYSAL